MNQTGGDPIAERLRKDGLPVTVENWLSFNHPDPLPKPVPTEFLLEAQAAVARDKAAHPDE